MSNDENLKKSRLISALREGVAVIQMVFFKELRTMITERHPDWQSSIQAMLAGAVTNELFGTPNPEPRFETFRKDYQAEIEQILLGLAKDLPRLRPYLTDALRIQVLCDSQEGKNDPTILTQAKKIGLLLNERDIPLPSVFMTLVRGLGEQHQLIIAPTGITEQDDTIIH
ncbi:MAG: hypothetical protein CSA26_01235 [Desulfobacterales bacterium]|nr:MAG: hypothetical protein CSA26_01235 [Desulfobacterales bacterium]